MDSDLRHLSDDAQAFLKAREDWKARNYPEDHPYARLLASTAEALGWGRRVEVGALVEVPASANHRVATVTEEASHGGRWRIDWYEPISKQHCWGWWDTGSLRVVASRGDVEQHELDRADEHMERMRP